MRHLICCVVLSGLTVVIVQPVRSKPLPSLLPTATATADTEYYYEPVPGKVIGAWPDVWTLQRLSQLRLQYGFSAMAVPMEQQAYSNALQAGFPPSSIMSSGADDDYIYAVANYPAGIYYVDEPAEHDCFGHASGYRLYTPQELITRRDYIHANRPGSLFVIGGYKRCSHNQIASTYADLFMYTSYVNWDQIGFPICHVNMGWGNEWENPWITGNADQRNSWTSMRNTFGTKFSMTWIHGGGDEYALLFAHANTLGLTGIWQYNGAPIDSARLESFCYIASQNGWLNRVAHTPLPIQLASFTASITQQHTVLLEWMTLSELNNYGFEVQRRAENEASFGTLPNSFIPGHGTTIEPHTYSFVDSIPPDRCRYRLKQIDLDGAVHFGPEVSVDIPTSVQNPNSFPTQIRLYQNYPNPFNPSTIIQFSLSQPLQIRLTIYNTLGQEIATLVDGTLSSGNQSREWNVGNLPGGVYIYKLQAGGLSETKKLVVVK